MKVARICKYCGQKFFVYACHLRGEDHAKRYCSSECRIKARTISKVCLQCKRTFSVSASRDRAQRAKFCSWECRSKGHAFILRGPENPNWKGGRTPEKNRQRNLQNSFGITVSDYEAMLTAQGGVCAICANPQKDKRGYPLFVDHDHRTGAIRGLLCSRCNHTVGVLENAIEEKARLYLKRHGQDAQAGDAARADAVEDTEDKSLDVDPT